MHGKALIKFWRFNWQSQDFVHKRLAQMQLFFKFLISVAFLTDILLLTKICFLNQDHRHWFCQTTGLSHKIMETDLRAKGVHMYSSRCKCRLRQQLAHSSITQKQLDKLAQWHKFRLRLSRENRSVGSRLASLHQVFPLLMELELGPTKFWTTCTFSKI